ncbi:DUF11 domain-containing protein [Marilutibacter chinensis]|uniref:DUF11 domain-containing protein n=1 Tax=Marilutibacter chinensis TaxID=2912247 RepID=A0ABS9HTK0_9GAMM|nr:DUF11 domain-containing protein [Lysobacter chinensis]MCF7221628.1 DUF11 domain-containing protein [Lysobacter chinensis]
MLWLLGSMLPAAANECRLADPNSNGEHVGTICWFQFGAIDEDLPSGTSNVPFEFDLPDGSRVELDVSVSGGTASDPRLTVRQAPTWTGSNFSGNSGFYTIFTPNAAALHSPDGRGNKAVLTLSDIRLYAPDGLEVTDLPFEIVVADAERLNSNPEHLDFGVVSGGSPWSVLEWLGNAPASAVQQGTPATLDPGVASACLAGYVDCLRFKGMTGGSDANAVVLASQKVVGSAQPFTVMGQIHSAAGQGFAVGVRCCAMRLRKVLPEGRADPADQFTYRIVNVNDQTVSTGTTSGTATGAYPYVSTMAMSGNALTLIEEMAPGSASTLDAYTRRVVCVNTRTGQTVLDDTYDPSAPPTLNILEMGDVVDCDMINTPLPRADVSVVKTATPETVVSGGQVTFTLAVANAGPSAADGTVLRDPAVAGLDCAAAVPSCSAGGGAACPASPTVAQLQSGGVTIPVLPAGGTVSVELTCTVTASGAP